MKRLIALLLLLSTPLLAASREPVRAKHVMIASVSGIASRVGADIMKKGGNAVDAAVAVGFALAVTWPSAGNLGGGGFMLIRKADGTAEAIDYRERAPLAATRTMYLDAQGNVIPKLSAVGHKAVGVPGTVAGLELAHRRHGKLKWAEVVEPARKLAAEGFEVSWHLAWSLGLKPSVARMTPFAESRRIFLRDGRAFQEGDRLVQPELAAVLARIRTNPRDFYEGATAKLIVDEMKRGGGLITAQDLRVYEPAIRVPLRGKYRGHEILTMPPPSSGGIALIEMLNMLETYDLKSMGWNSAAYVHTMTEVMRRAFADRAEYLGDTDFVKVPVSTLVSPAYAKSRLQSVLPDRATPSRDIRGGNPAVFESTETTHYTIVDAEGNVVANTYTLNEGYGAGVTVKGAGFLLNNEMDDFTARPGTPNEYGLVQGAANSIEPRKRPLSSMTPTIVLRDGKPLLAAGSPGGPTIINAVLHAIVNVVDFGMTAQEAVDAPRFHHQWLPDHLFWEERVFSPDTRALLEKMGHRFRDRSGFGDFPTIADLHIVMIDPKTGTRLGASDPRRGGLAVGW